MPPKNDKDKYNVYNKFDPNFVNYGELYKSPREMKQNSKYLINYYADALIKGESPIYIDSPNLVGNRYFINTNSQCLDKNDKTKTHPKSVLVDNVNTSAMDTTTDGNSGLIYSLLASLKTINGDEMFNDISNNQPTEYINNSTDYLKDLSNVPLPLCSEIKVFSDDKKKSVVSGWITSSDRQDIDPQAIQEGFIDVNDYVGGDLNPEQWTEGAKQTAVAMDEQAKTVSDEAQSSSDDIIDKANKEREKGPKQAKNNSKNSANMTKTQMKSQNESSKKKFKDAKRGGAKDQLKNVANEYLRAHSKENILFFIKTAINLRYDCAGDIQKTVEKVVITSGQQKLYDKYKKEYESGFAPSVLKRRMRNDGLDPKVVFDPPRYAKFKRMYDIGIAPSVIRRKMLADNLDPSKVLDVSDEQDPNSDKKKVRIPSKCIYSIFKENPINDYPSIDKNRSKACYTSPKISVKNVFNSISNDINKNKTNSKTLGVPGMPNSQLCYWSKEWSLPMGLGWTSVNVGYGRSRDVKKYEPSKDYAKMLSLLNKYRQRFAIEIVRYSNYKFYGPCDIIAKNEDKEGFTSMDSEEHLTPYESNTFINYGAYLFIIAMIFIIFFIVYKTMFRAFNFNAVFKKIKGGQK